MNLECGGTERVITNLAYHYSKKNIKTLIDSINKTELLIKKNYNNSINILLDFIINQAKKFNN